MAEAGPCRASRSLYTRLRTSRTLQQWTLAKARGASRTARLLAGLIRRVCRPDPGGTRTFLRAIRPAKSRRQSRPRAWHPRNCRRYRRKKSHAARIRKTQQRSPRRQNVRSLEAEAVAGLMVNDLEKQEGMDSINGLRVLRDQPDASAAIRFEIFVFNGLFQSSHRGNARRVGVMNQHRRFEIPCGKQLGDVAEVHAYLVNAAFIVQIVCTDVDFSTVWIQHKVMRGLLMRETHNVLTTLDHALLRIRSLRVLLQDGSEQKNYRSHRLPPSWKGISTRGTQLDATARHREAGPPC